MLTQLDTLLGKIRKIRGGNEKYLIDSRLKQFEKVKEQGPDLIFSELCFCLLTANFTADRSIKIQAEIGVGFETFSEKALAGILKKLGHRFPNARASYIVGARKNKKRLMDTLNTLSGLELRQWIVDNIKGLGYKESSHFLRNIGFFDYAIIDFHIIDILVEHKLIEKPKTLTKNQYLLIESVLSKICKKVDMSQGELDLYLWYIETGKILK